MANGETRRYPDATAKFAAARRQRSVATAVYGDSPAGRLASTRAIAATVKSAVAFTPAAAASLRLCSICALVATARYGSS